MEAAVHNRWMPCARGAVGLELPQVRICHSTGLLTLARAHLDYRSTKTTEEGRHAAYALKALKRSLMVSLCVKAISDMH